MALVACNIGPWNKQVPRVSVQRRLGGSAAPGDDERFERSIVLAPGPVLHAHSCHSMGRPTAVDSLRPGAQVCQSLRAGKMHGLEGKSSNGTRGWHEPLCWHLERILVRCLLPANLPCSSRPDADPWVAIELRNVVWTILCEAGLDPIWRCGLVKSTGRLETGR